jgi:tRNA A37 methylthiotransferase MiaB
VLETTTLERLRISSLGVEFCSDDLIALFAEPRIVAYAHLSIQSGSTSVLKAMNRHYDGERVREVLTKLRAIKRSDSMNLNIGADLIVGFPGESDADFVDTLECVTKYNISQLHAFPFSAHVDHYSVPAGVYPDQVPNHIAQSRIKSLQRAGVEVFKRWADETVGQEVRVLMEKVSTTQLPNHPTTQPSYYSGWTENYLSCDETNFEPYASQEIARGKVVKGIYRAILDKTPSE